MTYRDRAQGNADAYAAAVMAAHDDGNEWAARQAAEWLAFWREEAAK